MFFLPLLLNTTTTTHNKPRWRHQVSACKQLVVLASDFCISTYYYYYYCYYYYCYNYLHFYYYYCYY